MNSVGFSIDIRGMTVDLQDNGLGGLLNIGMHTAAGSAEAAITVCIRQGNIEKGNIRSNGI